VQFNGVEINDVNDVIQFLSPIQGLLYQGARALSIATHLDSAADRYATLETTPGLSSAARRRNHGRRQPQRTCSWMVSNATPKPNWRIE
jgi:hypothetical protein